MILNILRYPLLTSTNDEAKRLISEGAPEGTVVWADQQTAGRGRQGRHWVSQEGNLFCSIILRPDVSLDQIGQLSFVFALAVGDTIQAFLSEEAIQYKWPNDVLVQGKKISGILLETETCLQDKRIVVIAGIGLNSQSSPADTPYPTTCLVDHSVVNHSGEDILQKLTEAVQHWYAIWLREGFSSVRAEWLKKAYRLGEEIAVTAPPYGTAVTEKMRGRFDGIDEAGGLVILSEGRRCVLTSAEVLFV